MYCALALTATPCARAFRHTTHDTRPEPSKDIGVSPPPTPSPTPSAHTAATSTRMGTAPCRRSWARVGADSAGQLPLPMFRAELTGRQRKGTGDPCPHTPIVPAPSLSYIDRASTGGAAPGSTFRLTLMRFLPRGRGREGVAAMCESRDGCPRGEPSFPSPSAFLSSMLAHDGTQL
jgi:hypothetical protein